MFLRSNKTRQQKEHLHNFSQKKVSRGSALSAALSRNRKCFDEQNKFGRIVFVLSITLYKGDGKLRKTLESIRRQAKVYSDFNEVAG